MELQLKVMKESRVSFFQTPLPSNIILPAKSDSDEMIPSVFAEQKMNALTKSRFSWLHVIVTGLVIFLLACFLMASMGSIGERGTLTKNIACCRQVLIAMRLYAEDHDGAYPDAKLPSATDSNTVFRQLIITGALEDEMIFGCTGSPFKPDGIIGSAPEYAQSVEPGENHWAMTKGLHATSAGAIPLVYDNPVEADWPPAWNADASKKSVKGRCWPGGKVIIGTNDSSVEFLKLSAKTGNVTLKPLQTDEGNFFQQASAGPYQVLDFAIKE